MQHRQSGPWGYTLDATTTAARMRCVKIRCARLLEEVLCLQNDRVAEARVQCNLGEFEDAMAARGGLMKEHHMDCADQDGGVCLRFSVEQGWDPYECGCKCCLQCLGLDIWLNTEKSSALTCSKVFDILCWAYRVNVSSYLDTCGAMTLSGPHANFNHSV